MLKPEIYNMFPFKCIKHLLHRLKHQKVDAGRFWKMTA